MQGRGSESPRLRAGGDASVPPPRYAEQEGPGGTKSKPFSRPSSAASATRLFPVVYNAETVGTYTYMGRPINEVLASELNGSKSQPLQALAPPPQPPRILVRAQHELQRLVELKEAIESTPALPLFDQPLAIGRRTSPERLRQKAEDVFSSVPHSRALSSATKAILRRRPPLPSSHLQPLSQQQQQQQQQKHHTGGRDARLRINFLLHSTSKRAHRPISNAPSSMVNISNRFASPPSRFRLLLECFFIINFQHHHTYTCVTACRRRAVAPPLPSGTPRSSRVSLRASTPRRTKSCASETSSRRFR